MVNPLAKKITTVAVLITFLAGGVSRPSMANAEVPFELAQAQTSLDLSRFELPSNLGRVREKYQGVGGTVLILEDAHAQPDAQKNIEKIIRGLAAHYNVREVLLEGGAGQGDALLFRQFPDRKSLRATFDDYLSRGELSGSMSAAVFSKNPLQLYGAEDVDLYRNQILAYLDGLKAQPELLQKLSEEKQKLEARKIKAYSAELLDMDRSIDAYEKDGADEPQSLAEVFEKLNRLNPPTRYPLLEILRNELSQEKVGSQELLRQELENLFSAIRKKMRSLEDLKVFTQNKQAFETQQQDNVQIAGRLIRWAKSKKWDIPISDVIKRRIQEQRRLMEMKGPEFLAQWGAYVDETMSAQLKGAEAVQVYAESKELKFLERVIHFKLSREDWKKIVGLAPAGSEWPGTKFGFEPSSMSAQAEFYRLAEKREEVFVSKIKQRLVHASDSKTVVFVAGGFHTEGLQEAIKREGFSCAVITPVFQPSAETDRYEELMRGEVSWRSYFKSVKGSVDLKSAFNRATVDQLIEKQSELQSEDGAGRWMPGLKDWRDQLIRALARDGRLEDSGTYTRWIDQAVHPWQGKKDSGLDLSVEWKLKIENFLTGLKQLVDAQQLTESNLAGLFAAPALSPMGDKPFVAMPISGVLLESVRSESRIFPELSEQVVEPLVENASRSEVRALERYEGYSELKPVLQGALDILAQKYLIPLQALEIFKTVEIASPHEALLAGRNDKAGMETDLVSIRRPQEALSSLSLRSAAGGEAISGVRISEELVLAAKDDPAGQRVLARTLARFLDERSASEAGADSSTASAIGLRLDLFRFLGETPEEREQDLAFCKQHAALFTDVVGNGFNAYGDISDRRGIVPAHELRGKPFPTEYIQAHTAMQAKEAELAAALFFKQFSLQDEMRRTIVSEVTQAITADELLLREEEVRRKQIAAQVEAFKTQGFFNGAAKENPEVFWSYASLDLMHTLVLELTGLVRANRHQEVLQKIADKSGKPVDQVQQPIDFDLHPWQLFIKDFQEVALGSAGLTLESLYHFLMEGIALPTHLESYTDRDQKIGLLLERLGWNDPHRLFDADSMKESEKNNAVIRLMEFLAGDLNEPDEKRGHRWNFETMRFEETDPVAIADLPEVNLLTSYWIASQGKNMEVSRYGFFGEDSLRFTTGTLTGVHTAFYKRVQFASILRALGRNPTAQAFASLDRAGGDETIVQRITGNSDSLEQFKAEVAKDPALASQIIFSDDLRRRASSGFLKTNLEEIFAFQNFLKRLLPAVEKLQDEESKQASRYGTMTEAQAVQELGIAGLELKKLYDVFSTEMRTYGVLADGALAFFEQDAKPVLSVTVDGANNVTGIIFYTMDAEGRILFEDHRRILKAQAFDPALDLAGWRTEEGTLYGEPSGIVERVFYEEGRPVFRLKLNPDGGTITAADTIENVHFLPSSAISNPPSVILSEAKDLRDSSTAGGQVGSSGLRMTEGKIVQSFSIQKHKLVGTDYRFDPSIMSALDWLPRGVQVSPVEQELLPSATKQMEISPTKKSKTRETVRIHSQPVLPKGDKKDGIAGIELTHVIGPDETPELIGDFVKILKPDVPFTQTVTAWRQLLDDTEDPLYDRAAITARVFYDAKFYDETESKDPYRPVLELKVSDGFVEEIHSHGWDAAGEDEKGHKTYTDIRQYVTDKGADDFPTFDPEAGLGKWEQTPIRQRTFFNAEGRKTLVIELDPKNPTRVLSMKRFRKIENGKRTKSFAEINYPEAVLETINGRNFNATWSAEDWLKVLAPFELMESDVQAKGAFESARHDLLLGYQEKRKLLEQALAYYNQLQRGEITVDEAWIEAFDGFVQDVLRQGLRPWISDVDERPRDLSRILRRTMNLIATYGEPLGTTKASVPLRASLFSEKVLNAVLWSSDDYRAAAKAVLAGAEAQDVPAHSTGDFSQAISRVLDLYGDQVSPIVSAHERLLKRLGIPAANYDGNFTALRDVSPAMQAAYWAAQYLPAEYGVERPDEGFAHAAENDAASLLFTAEQTLQPLAPIAELTDVQADPWINKTAAWDNARTPGRLSWNPKRVEEPAENAALKPELSGTQEVLYEIYTLNGQQGPKSREAVSQKLYDASKLLKQDGFLVLMLPANKGLSEEGIEQIQASYGFERVEEGIAFNEFSPEYRNAEILRQQASPDQVAEAEDILQSQKFYVLILRKKAEIAVDKAYLPKNQLGIKTFDAPAQDLEGQVMKSRNVSGEVQMGARPRIQDLVKSLTPKQLRPVKPQSRGSRVIKKTAVTHSRVDHRKSDERDFPYITAKLGLLQKYRGMLFQNEKGLKDGTKRNRLQSLLNRTFTPSVDKIPRDISKLQTGWTDAQPLWWIEDREPQINQWPKSKMLVSKEGRQGLSVIISGGTITAVWSHSLDGRGRILYSEPHRLIKTGVMLKDENFETLKQMEGTLYSSEPDMSAIFTRRRTVYLPVFEAYRDLESLYPAMARYPALETWFLDDVWKSLESLIYQDPEDDEFNSLFQPFVENRDLVLKLKTQWENAEKIEVEDADRLVQLRRLVRNLRTVTQLWGGPTFGRGQPRTRKSAFGSPQAEAKAHGVTLNANPSFMSALAGAKYVQHLLEQNNGKLVMADLAAGSGALARALDKLDVKAPDSEFQYYELDLSRDYLNQKRPKRFEDVRGSHYKPVEGSVTDLPEDRGFSKDRFDLLTGFFIMDFLGEEESRAMFAQMNRVLKTGGEALLTLPQSWRLTPEYAEALRKMGFEIEVAPMRAAHTATDAWIESIKEHYGNTSIGNQIAEEVRRMKSKQFSILRIKKVSGFSGDLASVPLELFKLEKTDTGQRGKTTGDKPFDFGPQATHRWLEVLRWVVQDWNPQDLDAYDPAAQTVTRDEIIKNIFPEIEMEQALDKLYELRAIFSSEQEAGNDYEDIADFYTYWKSGFQQFRREDVERLAQLYRRGPPKNGNPPGLISSQDLLRKLESRADYFAGLNAGRSAGTYEHFERNQTLEKQILEKIIELRDFFGKLPQTHSLTTLAIPEDKEDLYGFSAQFSALQKAAQNKAVWSPRLIAGLDWFYKTIHKPGDNAVAALLAPPPTGLRSEVRSAETDDIADLELINSNWAVMLENARKENKPAENVMAAALHIGIAYQRLHIAGKLPKGESGAGKPKEKKVVEDPFETALLELKKIVPEFEEEWDNRYGFPTNLPDDPTDIANQLENFKLWRVSPADIVQADAFVQEWLSLPQAQRPKILERIKAWTGNETDRYTDLRSFNRRLLVWTKFQEQLQSNFQLDFRELEAIHSEFGSDFIFYAEISKLAPQVLLQVLQSILEAATRNHGFMPTGRVELLTLADGIFFDAVAGGLLTTEGKRETAALRVFDARRISTTSPLYRFSNLFSDDLDALESELGPVMDNLSIGLQTGNFKKFQNWYKSISQGQRIFYFKTLKMILDQIAAETQKAGETPKKGAMDFFKQLTDIMVERVDSLLEASRFFLIAAKWANAEAAAHARKKVAEKFLTLLDKPEKREELYSMLRTNTLATRIVGATLWQAEMGLIEDARRQGSPVEGVLFTGKASRVPTLIRESLARADDSALTAGALTLLSREIKSMPAKPGGSMILAAAAIERTRYEALFDRELLTENPAVISPIFLAPDSHLASARALGQWFYRTQKTMDEPARAQLWSRAGHWLDLLWLRYASSDPALSREALQAIFETEATGQTLPEDPLEAVVRLAEMQAAGREIWTATAEDHHFAEDKVITLLASADTAARKSVLDELGAWADVPGDVLGNQSLSRRYLVLLHLLKNGQNASSGAVFQESMQAVSQSLFPAEMPRRKVLEVSLLAAATRDEELQSAIQHYYLQQWAMNVALSKAVAPAAMDFARDLAEENPLKYYVPLEVLAEPYDDKKVRNALALGNPELLSRLPKQVGAAEIPKLSTRLRNREITEPEFDRLSKQALAEASQRALLPLRQAIGGLSHAERLEFLRRWPVFLGNPAIPQASISPKDRAERFKLITAYQLTDEMLGMMGEAAGSIQEMLEILHIAQATNANIFKLALGTKIWDALDERLGSPAERQAFIQLLTSNVYRPLWIAQSMAFQSAHVVMSPDGNVTFKRRSPYTQGAGPSQLQQILRELAANENIRVSFSAQAAIDSYHKISRQPLSVGGYAIQVDGESKKLIEEIMRQHLAGLLQEPGRSYAIAKLIVDTGLLEETAHYLGDRVKNATLEEFEPLRQEALNFLKVIFGLQPPFSGGWPAAVAAEKKLIDLFETQANPLLSKDPLEAAAFLVQMEAAGHKIWSVTPEDHAWVEEKIKSLLAPTDFVASQPILDELTKWIEAPIDSLGNLTLSRKYLVWLKLVKWAALLEEPAVPPAESIHAFKEALFPQWLPTQQVPALRALEVHLLSEAQTDPGFSSSLEQQWLQQMTTTAGLEKDATSRPFNAALRGVDGASPLHAFEPIQPPRGFNATAVQAATDFMQELLRPKPTSVTPGSAAFGALMSRQQSVLDALGSLDRVELLRRLPGLLGNPQFPASTAMGEVHQNWLKSFEGIRQYVGNFALRAESLQEILEIMYMASELGQPILSGAIAGPLLHRLNDLLSDEHDSAEFVQLMTSNQNRAAWIAEGLAWASVVKQIDGSTGAVAAASVSPFKDAAGEATALRRMIFSMATSEDAHTRHSAQNLVFAYGRFLRDLGGSPSGLSVAIKASRELSIEIMQQHLASFATDASSAYTAIMFIQAEGFSNMAAMALGELVYRAPEGERDALRQKALHYLNFFAGINGYDSQPTQTLLEAFHLKAQGPAAITRKDQLPEDPVEIVNILADRKLWTITDADRAEAKQLIDRLYEAEETAQRQPILQEIKAWIAGDGPGPFESNLISRQHLLHWTLQSLAFSFLQTESYSRIAPAAGDFYAMFSMDVATGYGISALTDLKGQLVEAQVLKQALDERSKNSFEDFLIYKTVHKMMTNIFNVSGMTLAEGGLNWLGDVSDKSPLKSYALPSFDSSPTDLAKVSAATDAWARGQNPTQPLSLAEKREVLKKWPVNAEVNRTEALFRALAESTTEPLELLGLLSAAIDRTPSITTAEGLALSMIWVTRLNYLLAQEGQRVAWRQYLAEHPLLTEVFIRLIRAAIIPGPSAAQANSFYLLKPDSENHILQLIEEGFFAESMRVKFVSQRLSALLIHNFTTLQSQEPQLFKPHIQLANAIGSRMTTNALAQFQPREGEYWPAYPLFSQGADALAKVFKEIGDGARLSQDSQELERLRSAINLAAFFYGLSDADRLELYRKAGLETRVPPQLQKVAQMMNQKLWDVSDEDYEKIKAWISLIFDPSKSADVRQQAESALTALVKLPGPDSFQAWSRVFMANNLITEYLRTQENIVYDPGLNMNKGISLDIDVSSASRLLQMAQLRLEGAEDPRLGVAAQRNIAAGILSLLEDPSRWKKLTAVEEQGLLESAPDDSVLARLRLLPLLADQTLRLIGGSIPDYASVTTLITAVGDPDLQEQRGVGLSIQATGLLYQLDRLLEDSTQRGEFKELLGNRFFAKFSVIRLLQELTVAGFLDGNRPTFSHLLQTLDEMLASEDPFIAGAGLSIVFHQAGYLADSRKMSSHSSQPSAAQRSRNFRVARAVQLSLQGKSYRDYGGVVSRHASFSVESEPPASLQTKVLFMEDVLKALLAEQKSGKTVTWPDLGDLTRELRYQALQAKVSEADLRLALQVSAGEPLTNNRFKKILEEAGVIVGPIIQLPEPLNLSRLSRDPVQAMLAAARVNTDRRIWVLQTQDKLKIQVFVDEIYAASDETARLAAWQKLDGFLTSGNRYQEWSRRYYAYVVLRRHPFLHSSDRGTIALISKGLPVFVLKMLSGTSFGQTPAEKIEELQILLEAAADENLMPQERIYMAARVNILWNILARAHSNEARFAKFFQDVRGTPSPLRHIETGVKAVIAPTAMSIKWQATIDSGDLEGRRFLFYTMAQAAHGPSSAMTQSTPDLLERLIPHLMHVEEFKDFFYYARAEAFMLKLPAVMQRLDEVLQAPAKRVELLNQMDAILPGFSIEILGNNLQMPTLFDLDRDAFPNFRETVKMGLQSDRPLLAAQMIRWISTYINAIYRNADELKRIGEISQALEVLKLARNQEAFVLDFFENLFREKGFNVESYDGLFLIVRPSLYANDRIGIWQLVAERAEKVMREALEQSPSSETLTRFNPAKARDLFTGLVGWEGALNDGDLREILGVPPGEPLSQNRFQRLANQYSVLTQTAEPASDDATVQGILVAVEKFNDQKLWNLTDEEKSKLRTLAEALVNSTTVTSAGSLPQDYTDYVNQVSGISRLARMVYGLSEVERAIAAQPLSLSEFKKKLDAVYLALREIARHGLPKTTEFFVAGMKMMHEFSEDPDFQGIGYVACGIAWEFYREIFYRLNPKTALLPEVDKLGELTNRWFVPPGIDRGSLSLGDPLSQVQSISQWILYVLYHPSTTTEEALEFLQLGNRLLAAPAARTVLVGALSVSSFFAIGLKARIAKVTAVWDPDNAEFENIRAAFLEAADSGNFHALQEVKGISEPTDMARPDKKNRDLFMTQFFIHLAPRPFEELPAWVFLVYRDFPKPDDLVARKDEFKLLVEHFSRQFTEARTKGAVVKEKIDRAVWLLVRTAATLDIPYRDLQQALGVPEVNLDVYDDNIFTRLAAESLALPVPEEVAEAIRIVREAPQNPLWKMTREEYQELEVYVDDILEAKNTATRKTALETFKTDMLDPALLTAQNWSRRFVSYAILKEKGFKEDHSLEVLRETMNFFMKEVFGDDTLGKTIPELFQELQLLTEASRDESFLSSQERYLLLVRARKTLEEISKQWNARRLPTSLNSIFENAQRDNVFYYYATPLGAQEYYVIDTFYPITAAYQRLASDSRNSLEFEVQVNQLENIDTLLMAARIVDQTSPVLDSPSRRVAFSFIWRKLQELLAKPEERQRFYRMARENEDIRYRFVQILKYAVDSEGDTLFNPRDPAAKPLSDLLLDGLASEDPRVLYAVGSLLHDLTGLYVQNGRDRGITTGAEARGGVLFEQFKWRAISGRAAARNFVPGQLYQLQSSAMAAYPIQTSMMYLSTVQEADLREMKTSLGVDVKGAVRNLEHFWTTWIAFSNGGQNELSGVLQIQGGNIHNNRFSRAAGLTRSEVRLALTEPATRQSLPLEGAEVRSTTRRERFETVPYNVQKISSQTAGYLIAGRMPPSAFLASFVHTAETDFDEVEQSMRVLADKPDELAVLSLQTSEWTDPVFNAGFERESAALQTQGIVSKIGAGADIVRVFTSLPQTDALIAAMKNQPDLNVYGIWQVEEFVGSGFKPDRTAEIRKLRDQAKRMEYEVNRALGSLDTRARFKLSVPESQWKLERLIKEAPSVLIGLNGRRDTATVMSRVVVVYDSKSQLDTGVLSEHQSLRHKILAADKNRFSKEYLLYESAAEISQDTLSQLYRAFIRGEGHFSFQDDRISSDLLASFVGMEHLIAQQFASAA